MSEITKKQLNSFIGTLVFAVIAYYFGNRLGEVAASYGGVFFEHLGDAFGSVVPAILEDPAHVSGDMAAVACGLVFVFVVFLIWLQYFAFIGNYRSGEESGSARWGTEKEGKKFLDAENPDNNILFSKNFGIALKRKKFNLELDRNLNVIVIGGSGSGKTRNYVKPNLMQLNASYFVTDPKGTLLTETGHLFEDHGYEIRSFNTIDFEKSMHYNPLAYVKTDADILSFVNCLIANTSGDGTKGDPFWENAERLLYTALIALLRDWFKDEYYSLSGVLTLLSMAEARENDENFKSALDLIFLQIEEGKKYVKTPGGQGAPASQPASGGGRRVVSRENADYSWQPSDFVRKSDGAKPGQCGGLSADQDFALSNYKAFKTAAGKTLKSILISCNVRLAPIAIGEVRELVRYDEMHLDTLGDPGKKSIIFGILSDTDRTYSFLFAMMMWQCMDQLCRKALSDYGGRLPTPVNFIFDEFANIGTIPDIDQTIAVVRSRNIGVSIILQSVAQLESRYEKTSKTIIDCCDTTVFLGGKSNSTNKEIAEMIGKETINQLTYNQSHGGQDSASKNMQIQGRDLIDPAEIGKMSRRECIVLIAGTNPLMDEKYPVEKHPRYKWIDPGSRRGALYKENFDFIKYRDKKG